jgi:hypothetical protein
MLQHTCVCIFGLIVVIIQFSKQRSKGVYFRTVLHSYRIDIERKTKRKEGRKRKKGRQRGRNRKI